MNTISGIGIVVLLLCWWFDSMKKQKEAGRISDEKLSVELEERARVSKEYSEVLKKYGK
jgi:hypothetical protein